MTMTRQLALSPFAVCLWALLGGARVAGAQAVEAIAPAAIDVSVSGPARLAEVGGVVPSSVLASSVALSPLGQTSIVSTKVVRVGREFSDLAAAIRPASGILLRDASDTVESPDPRDFAAVLRRGRRMQTSRALMIGGTAAAVIGLLVVNGDSGAIIALAGGGVAVYGLYLHYNR